MISIRRSFRSACRLAAVAALFVGSAANASAQSPLWGGLRAGRYAVGFEIRDTVDLTRSFPGRSGQPGARPMRIYMWYPARAQTGTPMRVSNLVSEAWANGGVMRPASELAFSRMLVRARSGPAFVQMTDSGADSVLAMPLVARRNAVRTSGRFPVIMLAPGQPITMPVAAEYLASHGYIVIGTARKDDQTFESMEFTPNRSSLAAEADDLAFLLGVIRSRRDADAARVGLLGYSSSSLSNLALAFRSHVPRAIVAFEGWEGWEAGQPFVKALPGFDPASMRSAYLLIEKTAEESATGFGKTNEFFDLIAFSPRSRVAFDDAIHTDFASLAVSQSGTGTLRRNFVRAHEVLLSFMNAEVGAGTGALHWQPPASESYLHITSFMIRDRTPTAEEFFHLAETDPLAAEELAQQMAQRGVIPFTETSLSRLALISGSRQPLASAVLYGIVARAFPMSLNAQVRWSDALANVGRAAEAQSAARSALQLLSQDSTLSVAQKDALRQRLTARLQ